MAISYPHKQTIFIFVLCALVVGGVVFYRMPHYRASLTSQNTLSVQPSASPLSLAVVDANKNNIPDWEEQFSGSDTIDTVAPTKQGTDTKEQQDLTLTAQLGRSFFTQYVNLKQAGLFNDPNAVTETMQALVENAVDSEGPHLYKITDIKEIPSSDAATLEKWTDAVSQSFETFTWSKNEAMLANEALTRQDPAILKKIAPIVAGYSKIITSLRGIPTPEPLSLPMVNLINAVSTLKYGAQAMQSFGTDPLRGTIGVRAFSEGGQALVRALQEIDAVVAREGIVFEINGMVFETLTHY